MISLLYLSCASDIKIAPHKDSGLLYGLELSPLSYDITEVPLQNDHSFDFSLFAHEKTTLHTIDFSSVFDEDTQWAIESFLQPPITLSAGSKINFAVIVTPQAVGLFDQDIEIISTREDWNITLQIQGIQP
jgi:hypothetical protein